MANTGTAPRAPYRRLLRQRPFLLLWAGSAVSNLGDQFFALALMWFTYAATRSSLEVAAVAVVFQLTYVAVGPAAGVFADRWDHRRTMIVCDGARAAILTAFALVTWRAGFSLPLALVAVFLLESAGRFFGPSRLAYMPILIERDDLTTANGLFTGTRQTAALAGQALAGLVISGVGALAGFVADAVSFVLSALALTIIRTPRSPEAGPPAASSHPETSRHGFWSELREGYQILVGIPVIRTLLLFATFSNAAFAMIEPAMPAYIRTTLHSGAWAYGLVGSFQFGGALLGAFLAGGITARLRAGTLIVATTAFDGAALVAAGLCAWSRLPWCCGCSGRLRWPSWEWWSSRWTKRSFPGSTWLA